MKDSHAVMEAIVLPGKSPTRVGLMDSPWTEALTKWTTQGYPKGPDGKPVDPVDHFGYDMCGGGGWFDIMPIRGHNEIIQETEEWKVVRNGAGADLKWWKNKSGTPEHINFRMTSREIWESDYRPYLLQLDRKRVNIEETRKTLARRRAENLWTSYGHLFMWENMRASMGDVCLYESMLLDPGWIHDYGRVYTDFFKAHYKLLFDEAGLPDGVWMYEDMGYKNATFASPDLFGRLIFPYFREMIEFFHSYKLSVTLHSCGLVEPLLDMIVDVGFDGLNPMEVKAGNDPLRIAAKYKDKLAFYGGLDARVLESHDKALIQREVSALIEGMKKVGARFVFASDHSISSNVDYADYQHALEDYHKHKMY